MLDRVGSRTSRISVVQYLSTKVTELLREQTFSVKWKDLSGDRKWITSGVVTLDGIYGGQKIIQPGHLRRHDTAERSYVSTGPRSTRPYLFSNIQLTGPQYLSFVGSALHY
jgi:hypothetical protein